MTYRKPSLLSNTRWVFRPIVPRPVGRGSPVSTPWVEGVPVPSWEVSRVVTGGIRVTEGVSGAVSGSFLPTMRDWSTSSITSLGPTTGASSPVSTSRGPTVTPERNNPFGLTGKLNKETSTVYRPSERHIFGVGLSEGIGVESLPFDVPLLEVMRGYEGPSYEKPPPNPNSTQMFSLFYQSLPNPTKSLSVVRLTSLNHLWSFLYTIPSWLLFPHPGVPYIVDRPPMSGWQQVTNGLQSQVVLSAVRPMTLIHQKKLKVTDKLHERHGVQERHLLEWQSLDDQICMGKRVLRKELKSTTGGYTGVVVKGVTSSVV